MFLLYQIKAIFIALLLMVFGLFPATILSIPFPLGRRLKIVGPVWAFCSRMLLRHGLSASIDVEEDHRSPEMRPRPCSGLYISNHQSYIDIPLTIMKFQVPPIMKKEVLYIPIFGWLAWLCGAMPVSRSSGNSRKRVFVEARKRFKVKKIGVQLYPEGTRSKTALPKLTSEIKKPLLVFAYNENIPVVPVSLYGTRGVLTPHGLVRPHRHLGIIIHKEVLPQDFESAEAFVHECWGKVLSGHDAIKSRLGPLNESLS